MLRIVVVLAALSGCATPYQPLGSSGGYDDMQVDDDVYQVSFYGNGFTPMSHVEHYWLVRCAQIAEKNQAPYFEVIESKDRTATSAFTSPTNCSGTNSGGQFNATCTGGGTNTVSRHSFSGRIRVLKDKPSQLRNNVYKTDLVLTGAAKKAAH